MFVDRPRTKEKRPETVVHRDTKTLTIPYETTGDSETVDVQKEVELLTKDDKDFKEENEELVDNDLLYRQHLYWVRFAKTKDRPSRLTEQRRSDNSPKSWVPEHDE